MLSQNTDAATAADAPYRRPEAAEYIRQKTGAPCSPKTLAKLAVIGGGPAFRKIGRWPIYSRVDLDAWIAARVTKLVRSTSELDMRRCRRTVGTAIGEAA